MVEDPLCHLTGLKTYGNGKYFKRKVKSYSVRATEVKWLGQELGFNELWGLTNRKTIFRNDTGLVSLEDPASS